MVAGGMLYQESEVVREGVDATVDAVVDAGSAAADGINDAWGDVTTFFGSE